MVCELKYANHKSSIIYRNNWKFPLSLLHIKQTNSSPFVLTISRRILFLYSFSHFTRVFIITILLLISLVIHRTD